MFLAFEKVFGNKNQVVCIKYYPVNYISDIVNPHKIFPDIPSLKKIKRNTQNDCPCQKMEQNLDFISREKVFHGFKSRTNNDRFIGSQSDFPTNLNLFISEGIDGIQVCCFTCRIPSEEYTYDKTDNECKYYRLCFHNCLTAHE